VARRATLRDGARTIDLHWFGRGNTRGDLVIHIPSERIVATGDLIVWPMPFAFLSYPTEWVSVLDSIKALQPAMLVPGHGPVMRDLGYLNTVQGMLVEARREARDAASRGLTGDSLVNVVTLENMRNKIAGDDKWMKLMFGMFFRRPVLGRFYEEAKSGTLK
ncbi:MAG TPA: hypothetical protein VM939_13985, partial [Gemmatimonadaceae bacterium]|nr:hypothetical protein [Gemmatimonadaceae bacterium]